MLTTKHGATCCHAFLGVCDRVYVHVRIQVVASAIVDKYIGESARVIREMFGTWILWSVVVPVLGAV